MALLSRFLAKVERTEECWLWTAAIDDAGYGRINVDGRNSRAYRVAYELFVGPVPAGLDLDHLCRNRACVNPAHLEPVTRAENTMRGVSFAAENARKQTCPQGHPYDHVDPRGRRRCQRCHRERRRKVSL